MVESHLLGFLATWQGRSMDPQANVQIQLSLAVNLRYVPRRSLLFKINV